MADRPNGFLNKTMISLAAAYRLFLLPVLFVNHDRYAIFLGELLKNRHWLELGNFKFVIKRYYANDGESDRAI